jgi:hypothetical protein
VSAGKCDAMKSRCGKIASVDAMERRRGPRPGVRQRGNTASYDPRSRLPYRTTLTFPDEQVEWLRAMAAGFRQSVPRVLVGVARGMPLAPSGVPQWASEATTADQIRTSTESFRATGRPRRHTVEFPPAVAAKIVVAAETLELSLAEVLRGEIRRLIAFAQSATVADPCSTQWVPKSHVYQPSLLDDEASPARIAAA